MGNLPRGEIVEIAAEGEKVEVKAGVYFEVSMGRRQMIFGITERLKKARCGEVCDEGG